MRNWNHPHHRHHRHDVRQGTPGGQARENRPAAGRGGDNAPYGFVERKAAQKKTPEALHHRLDSDRFDIAFQITWKALTPLALNPVGGDETCQCGMKGYNRRWLMYDNKLCISPFTVKSAVANGVANLLGGCYRVNDKEEAPGFREGVYPYTCGWKRYRVDRDTRRSKPGIVRSIVVNSDGSRTIEIDEVEEYLYDKDPLPAALGLTPGSSCYLDVDKSSGPMIVKDLRVTHKTSYKPAVYHGPYVYGLNNQFKGGAPDGKGKVHKHYHRFYARTGKFATGTLRKEYFDDIRDLQGKVYMGRYCNERDGGPWYDDLRNLKADDWVYYEEFGGQVAAIGHNFLFKAIFFHPDTVPADKRLCTDPNMLCPRCALFGATDGRKEKDSVGLKGRFKASALVGNEELKPGNPIFKDVPCLGRPGNRAQVKLERWTDGRDADAALQVLLPIQGPPKPNRRDKAAYFDTSTGFLKGAKYYRHALFTMSDLMTMIKKIDANLEINPRRHRFKYSHELRNYAMVCRENMSFTGTLGVENCSVDELAALVTLLDTGMAGNGFKVGLGKAFGLGSVESHIEKIWVRKPDSYYTWDTIDGTRDMGKDMLISAIDRLVEGFADAVRRLGDTTRLVNSITGRKKPVEYPRPSPEYWDSF